MRENLAKKFLNGLPLDADTCWPWAMSTYSDNGYGAIKHSNVSLKAHRVSYELFKGPIPKGFVVRHTCDNKQCVNPSHLIIGTPQDNVRDMDERGRRCVGQDSPRAKLTRRQVRIIFFLYHNQKMQMETLAQVYGVGYTAIQKIVRGHTWKHLNLLQELGKAYKS